MLHGHTDRKGGWLLHRFTSSDCVRGVMTQCERFVDRVGSSAAPVDRPANAAGIHRWTDAANNNSWLVGAATYGRCSTRRLVHVLPTLIRTLRSAFLGEGWCQDRPLSVALQNEHGV
jgi:hypothetical protein